MDSFLTLYLGPDLKLENCISNLFLGICKTKKLLDLQFLLL